MIYEKNLDDLIKYVFIHIEKNEDFIDEKAFLDNIYLMLETLKLSNYVKKVSIVNSKLYVGCYYEKELIFNFEMMKKLYYYKLIDKQKYVLEILRIILHEIIHVNHSKIINENIDLITKEIIELSYYLKFITDDKVEFHNLFPDERDANINSGYIIYRCFGISDYLIKYVVDGFSHEEYPFAKLERYLSNNSFKFKEMMACLCDTEKLIYGFDNVFYNEKLDNQKIIELIGQRKI